MIPYLYILMFYCKFYIGGKKFEHKNGLLINPKPVQNNRYTVSLNTTMTWFYEDTFIFRQKKNINFIASVNKHQFFDKIDLIK